MKFHLFQLMVLQCMPSKGLASLVNVEESSSLSLRTTKRINSSRQNTGFRRLGEGTDAPSTKPTESPSQSPSLELTSYPTAKPVTPYPKPATPKPTAIPATAYPTRKPTAMPVPKPTPYPTDKPVAKPTNKPTPYLTSKPTPKPTEKPSAMPTYKPAPEPSKKPTPIPTMKPTPKPTPKSEPYPKPTDLPTSKPSPYPTYACRETVFYIYQKWHGTAVEPNGTQVDIADASKDIGVKWPFVGDVYDEDGDFVVGYSIEQKERLDNGSFWHGEGTFIDLYGCSGHLAFSGFYEDATDAGHYVITGGSHDFLGAEGYIYEEMRDDGTKHRIIGVN
ncbi:hypothetical protein ACA910_020479 [Epithemia clementina (nom. ined.)]